MPLDLPTFASKLRRLLSADMFGESVLDLHHATGIETARLHELEAGASMPTGDEILILSDHFREPFTFFLSNEKETVLERTEKLFRAYDTELSANDRWAIQEFLFMCETEAFLLKELGRSQEFSFAFLPEGSFYKRHGELAAERLRQHLHYQPTEVPDVFHDLRSLGLRIFRRKLENRKISGLFIDHPIAGPCLLVNYSEDVYRQRFTLSHEAAHAIFDRKTGYVVSFLPSSTRWSEDRLREIRADAFASSFLASPQMLAGVKALHLDEEQIIRLANQLQLNVEPVRRALVREGRLTSDEAASFSQLRVPKRMKSDPELPSSLTEAQRLRKLSLLERGLSPSYVDLCIEANQRDVITRNRLAEVLLLEPNDLDEVQRLFRVVPKP